jgi:hypothetical protein
MNDFKFNLNDAVQVSVSAEVVVVIARAEYVTSENSYLVRYAASNGNATQTWWGESALRSC